MGRIVTLVVSLWAFIIRTSKKATFFNNNNSNPLVLQTWLKQLTPKVGSFSCVFPKKTLLICNTSHYGAKMSFAKKVTNPWSEYVNKSNIYFYYSCNNCYFYIILSMQWWVWIPIVLIFCSSTTHNFYCHLNVTLWVSNSLSGWWVAKIGKYPEFSNHEKAKREKKPYLDQVSLYWFFQCIVEKLTFQKHTRSKCLDWLLFF